MEETLAQLRSASDRGFDEMLVSSILYSDDGNETANGYKQARNPNNDYSMLAGTVSVNVFNPDQYEACKRPSLNSTGFSDRNLVPINLNEVVQDGCMTVAAFSNDVTSVIDKQDVRQTNLTGVGVTVYHLSHRDYEPQFEPALMVNANWNPFWQNCIPLLVLASLAGEYRLSEYDDNLVILTDSQPNLATSHITEVSKSGTATRRDYDTYATAKTRTMRLSTTAGELGPAGSPPVLTFALMIAAKLWPNSYKALIGDFKLKTAYRPTTLKGLMLNALREIPIPPDKLQLLIAEASACLGRVHGTSDESMVERQVPIVMCVHAHKSGPPSYKSATSKLSARDVRVAMAQGIISFDAGYTKLLNMFSVQTDPSAWQRGEQLTTLASKGVDLSHKTKTSYDTVCIAKVLNKTGYGRATKHDYDRRLKWVQGAGHCIREDKLDGTPLMKKSVQQTRDILSSDTPLGAETRAQHRRNYNSNQPYAHSLASDQAEYISDQGDANGVQMCNVMSPRSTAGALIANTLWIDSTSAIIGCDRQLNVFHNGTIEGRLSQVTLQATELKRYGYELEASDRRSCGIGNSRREYGFFSNEQIAVSFKISKITKMLGKLTAKSNLRARIGADDVIDAADLSWFSATRANTDLIIINGIHSNIPDIYKKSGDPMHSMLYSFSTFDVKYDLRSASLGLPITSSASRATVSIPGGLSVKRLAYEAPARLIPNGEGILYAINGDLARCGADAYGALLMKQIYGVNFGKTMEPELFALLLDRSILDVEHKWKNGDYALLALNTYKSKLGSLAKRTIERLVWHACTGYIIVAIKTMIAQHKAISENVKPLQVAVAVHETTHFIGQMLFTALNLVYNDLGWDDCVGKAHLMTLAITDRGIDWCMRNEAQLSRCLSADVGLPLNVTCDKSGRCCKVSCFAEGNGRHVCYSCKRSIDCNMCNYNEGLLDGQDPIERCVANNEKNRTLSDSIDDQRYVTEVSHEAHAPDNNHRLIINLAHTRCCNGSGKVFTNNERMALASRQDNSIGLSQAIDMMFNPDTPTRESAALATYKYDDEGYVETIDDGGPEDNGDTLNRSEEPNPANQHDDCTTGHTTTESQNIGGTSTKGMTIAQLLSHHYGKQRAWDLEPSDEEEEYDTANEATPRNSMLILGKVNHPVRTSSLPSETAVQLDDNTLALGSCHDSSPHTCASRQDELEYQYVAPHDSRSTQEDKGPITVGPSVTRSCDARVKVAIEKGQIMADCLIQHTCHLGNQKLLLPGDSHNGMPTASDEISALPDHARLLTAVAGIAETDCLTLGCTCAGCASVRNHSQNDDEDVHTFTGGDALWHYDPLELGDLKVTISPEQISCWGPNTSTLLSPHSRLWPFCWLASVLGVHVDDIPFEYVSNLWREGLMARCPERHTRQNYSGKLTTPADISVPMIIKNLAHGTLCCNKMKKQHQDRLIRRGTHYIYSFRFVPRREDVQIDYRAVEHFTQMIPWIHESLVATDNQKSVRLACSGADTGDWNHYDVSINPLDEHEPLVIRVEWLSTCQPTRKNVTKLPRIKQSPKMINILCNLWTENMRDILENPDLDY
nr:hypothetical protein [Cordyceps militaris quadrivirus 2]